MKRGAYILFSALMCAVLYAAAALPFSGEAAQASSAYRHRIVIDAGHGGIDGGATGCTGTLEKDINLAIALKCEQMCGLFGIDVTMTRSTDTALDDGSGATIAGRKADDIKKRVAIANSDSEALVSIHMNSFPDQKYWGTQTFYSKNHAGSKLLADCLQASARALLAPDNEREVKQAEDGIYLLKHVTTPAVIIECGFISNPDEEARLNDEEYRKAVAAAVCAGTYEFLNGAL